MVGLLNGSTTAIENARKCTLLLPLRNGLSPPGSHPLSFHCANICNRGRGVNESLNESYN